jgi:hypothetical protein
MIRALECGPTLRAVDRISKCTCGTPQASSWSCPSVADGGDQTESVPRQCIQFSVRGTQPLQRAQGWDTRPSCIGVPQVGAPFQGASGSILRTALVLAWKSTTRSTRAQKNNDFQSSVQTTYAVAARNIAGPLALSNNVIGGNAMTGILTSIAPSVTITGNTILVAPTGQESSRKARPQNVVSEQSHPDISASWC